MSLNKIIFEIPIYRITKDEFYKETEKKKNQLENELPKLSEKTVNNLLNLYKYPYKYNEVVGYIELYVCGTQIRADYWYCTVPGQKRHKKRLNRGITKKEFFWFGKKLEIGINQSLSNDEIFKLIIDSLKNLNRQGIFQKRYFDIEQLLTIGKYIDWKGLIKDKEVNFFSV